MSQQQWNRTVFPKIIASQPRSDLSDYVSRNREQIDSELEKTGAVLFRGFHVPTVERFDAAVEAYGAENFPYAESLSNAVRINLTPRVFTANEAPPTTSIFLHHEMAQTPIYPSKLFFYCHKAANEGGATPLCRSDILFQKLKAAEPKLVKAFADKGVKYSNTMPAMDDPGSGQGRSWKSTLSADDRSTAEVRLQSLGYSFEWGEHDTLRMTSPRLDAIRTLPDGTKVFFNQLIAAYRGWADKRNDPSKSVTFGDGTPISSKDMATAIRISDDLTYDLCWQSGDVALIDNFRVMHGRHPYEGTRKVLASLIR